MKPRGDGDWGEGASTGASAWACLGGCTAPACSGATALVWQQTTLLKPVCFQPCLLTPAACYFWSSPDAPRLLGAAPLQGQAYGAAPARY
jgi:hypothetical protein